MTTNLMDKVRGMLTPETLGKASDSAGGSPESTRRGMMAAIPTIFAGLTQGASTPGGAARLFGALTDSAPSGRGLMGAVFGERSAGVSDALAKGSGMESGSASRLLVFALPMVAGVLGKHIHSERLDANGLSPLLVGHKKAILDDPATPTGLAGALGMRSLSELGGSSADPGEPHVTSAETPRTPRTPAPPPREPPVVEQRSVPWNAALAALLLAGLAIWGISTLVRGHAPQTGVTAPQPTMPAVPQPRLPAIPGIPETPNVPHPESPAAGPLTLPDGKTLDVDRNGPEAHMARYLSDTSAPLPHAFQFDKLSFPYGTAALSPDATKTTADVATVLQAYPSARVRVEGHTDNVGSPAENQTLSEARGNAIKGALEANGVDADRIEVTGKSEEGAVAGNESEEGRALNRRAEIVLLSR
jgi:outer membrane protein OmpA-like peptidoglycan-associated protein